MLASWITRRWPRERFSAVLNQAGLPVTLAVLEDMAERWTASGEEPAVAAVAPGA